jgi:RNA recognition motif-containing protein
MLGGHSRTSSFESILSDSYDSKKNTTLSDSHDQLLQDLQDVRLAVIKISNISWDLTSKDVIEYLENASVERHHVHIPIDRSTGKTKADMFVELRSIVEGIKCMAKYSKRILKGRAVTVSLSSLEELYSTHFNSSGSDFFSQSEAVSLVNICRNYKVSHPLSIFT